MIKKIVNNFTKGLVGGLMVLAGIGTAFAITVLKIESSWSEGDFEVGKSITQNMALSTVMGYTCYNSTCSQKTYWRKFNGNNYTLRDAQHLCNSYGMSLPTTATFAKMYYQNFNGVDNAGSYVPFRSMNNPSTRYWSQTKHDGPSWNAYYFDLFYPSGLQWTYSQRHNGYQVVCVYKN